MSIVFTIATEPNTTLTLPATATITKNVNDYVTITVNNQSEAAITLSAVGTGASFTLISMPASIASGASGTIVLEFLENGTLTFTNGVDTTVITVREAGVSRGCVHPSDAAIWDVSASDAAVYAVAGSDEAVWTVEASDQSCPT